MTKFHHLDVARQNLGLLSVQDVVELQVVSVTSDSLCPRGPDVSRCRCIRVDCFAAGQFDELTMAKDGFASALALTL